MTLPDINTQIANFFVNSGAVPPTSAGNTITPLVDGSNYFGALRKEVDNFKTSATPGKFFYFTNWLLELVNVPSGPTTAGTGRLESPWPTPSLPPITPFKLDDLPQGKPGNYPDFIDELASMAANGVDIRALPWVSPLVAEYLDAAKASNLYWVIAANLYSANALRAKPGLGKSVCLSVVGHSMGAMHLKMVVCGDQNGARAYVAGLDFSNDKIDQPGHPNGKTDGWHDAGAQIIGPAVQDIYDHFRNIWGLVVVSAGLDLFHPRKYRVGSITVPIVVDDTDFVPDRKLPVPPAAGMHVQVLRTVPAMNFASGSTARVPLDFWKRSATGFRTPPWPIPMQNGVFEFEASVMKAINSAQQYIYIEDQSFRSWPIMDALALALKNNPQLKLIMVHHSDPADGDDFKWTAAAINNHLAASQTDMSAQVSWAERTDQTTVHSKTWIIDDQFVIIGSANCYRRSQATDAELSIAVLDEAPSPSNFAVLCRLLLWGEHCGLLTDADRAKIADINDAIRIWNASWSVGGAPPPPAPLLPVADLTSAFQFRKVPFQAGPDQFPAIPAVPTQIEYDQSDPDSRLVY